MLSFWGSGWRQSSRYFAESIGLDDTWTSSSFYQGMHRHIQSSRSQEHNQTHHLLPRHQSLPDESPCHRYHHESPCHRHHDTAASCVQCLQSSSEGQGSLQSLSKGPITLYTAACNSLPNHVRAGDAAQAYLAKVKVRLCSCQTGYNQGKMIIWPTIHGLRMVQLVLMCNALVLLALSCAQAFSNALSRAPM